MEGVVQGTLYVILKKIRCKDNPGDTQNQNVHIAYNLRTYAWWKQGALICDIT